MKKVLVADYVHPSMISGLEERRFQVLYNKSISLEMVKEIIHDYHGIVINSKIIMDKNLIDKGANLSFIARLGSGMEIVDIPYARKKGIRVINSPEGNCNAVAEHALGMLLMLSNNLNKGNTEVKNFIWQREENRGWELKEKTIGIIGVGHTGTALIQKLKNWDMRIIGYDKYRKGYASSFIEEGSLEQIQSECDIISFHLPLTPETKHFCNRKFLEKCKKSVFLVNTSRGNVVETEALIDALADGKVAGACLDVFENEKPKSLTVAERKMYTKLYAYSNVIVTPHVAGWTHESLKNITNVVLEKIDSGYSM